MYTYKTNPVYDLGSVNRIHSGTGETTAWQRHSYSTYITELNSSCFYFETSEHAERWKGVGAA